MMSKEVVYTIMDKTQTDVWVVCPMSSLLQGTKHMRVKVTPLVADTLTRNFLLNYNRVMSNAVRISAEC